jgi:hypothetical protein
MKLRAPLVTGFVLGLAALLLGACSSTPATRFYTLAATAAAPAPKAADAARPLTLVVADVRLPLYLDRPQIVTRGGDNRVRIAEFEHWGGNLRDDMIRVLAENLARLLPGDRVVAAPAPVPLAPDWRIVVEVQRFELDADGRVRLTARWWLSRGADGTAVAGPETTLAGAAVGDGSYDALVGAMSSVYAELAQAVARGLPGREAAKP